MSKYVNAKVTNWIQFMIPAYLWANLLSWRDIGNRSDKNRKDLIISLQEVRIEALKFALEKPGEVKAKLEELQESLQRFKS